MYHAYPLEFEYLTGQADPVLLVSLKTNSMAGVDKPHIILQEAKNLAGGYRIGC